ncbi:MULTISPECIES: hypothetical protein [Halomicrobium]|uniref:Uncharacterized protein n=2 Tax=Halomicrobium mukohataei TaxID=57705 RepID=C7P144_HALMD|nr:MULTISPECIES: hypothetical protein [Halomicrobium]ACV49059.1 conserved hypothetical protein [Halomicrobium mukohataei DSM 12286]QCD64479.1 hypothetical protein E5139_02055 [Halomicrobium mukohataei]QFR19285.1 hypothetical protein GBQ70_02055 [Halomicrobium sp. ZPS1]
MSDESRREWVRRAITVAGTLSVRATSLGAHYLYVVARLVVVTGVLVVVSLLDDHSWGSVRRWFLLDGNRWSIAVLLTGVVYATLVALIGLDVVGMSNAGFVTGLFTAIISGLFSFVPIVVSVNQLTVARVVGSLDEIREQMNSVRQFRAEIEAVDPAAGVSSNDPGPFLAALVAVVDERVERLADELDATTGPAHDTGATFVAVLRSQVAHIQSRVTGQRQPIEELLVPMMGDNYPYNVQTARKLLEDHGDDLSPPARTLIEELKQLSIALDLLRQYYKALYIKQALSRLSRIVGYTGLGAFLIAGLTILVFANGRPLVAHPFVLELLVGLAVAAVVFPFTVLLSFVVRIATIGERTAAPGPFTPVRETPSYARHSRD